MGMKRILNYMDGKFHCELLYAHGYRNRNVTRQEVLDEHYGKVIRKLEKGNEGLLDISEHLYVCDKYFCPKGK